MTVIDILDVLDTSLPIWINDSKENTADCFATVSEAVIYAPAEWLNSEVINITLDARQEITIEI